MSVQKMFSVDETQKNYLPFSIGGSRITNSTIEDGKEIILYSRVFVDRNWIMTYNEDEFI